MTEKVEEVEVKTFTVEQRARVEDIANAQLKDELESYFDEGYYLSVDWITQKITKENQCHYYNYFIEATFGVKIMEIDVISEEEYEEEKEIILETFAIFAEGSLKLNLYGLRVECDFSPTEEIREYSQVGLSLSVRLKSILPLDEKKIGTILSEIVSTVIKLSQIEDITRIA
ncbi:MAG: hypothetical protein QXH44_10095 [Pyrobaculum sp.]